jgi:hypothetical protein
MLAGGIGCQREAGDPAVTSQLKTDGSDAGSVELDHETGKALAALGYADWDESSTHEELQRAGVTLHLEGRAQDGLNLYKSLPSDEVQLIDMSGAVAHTWTAPEHNGKNWHHVEMTEKGELFGLRVGPLQKLDWNSKLLWEAPIRAHHDIDFDERGRIYALTEELVVFGRQQVPILDNRITVLSPDGEVLQTLSFALLFASDITPRKIQEIGDYWGANQHQIRDDAEWMKRSGSPLDVFHANSIELLERDVPGLGARGNILVSIRTLDKIAVIDLEKSKVVWSWGPGIIDHPHHATLLADDTISLFDNGWFRTWSRVLTLDPRTGEIVWQYPREPSESFYSKRRGSAQHLPNGNVLVTESERGHVLEITRDGNVVWEFFNPQIGGENNARARIYRMERIDPAVAAGLPLNR